MKLMVFLWIVISLNDGTFQREIPQTHRRNPLFCSKLRDADVKPLSLGTYNSASQINNYLETLAKNYPHLVTVQIIGWSHEDRPIRVVKVTTNPNSVKPGVLIDAGIHAREWIAPAVAINLINEIVVNYENNKNVTDAVEWHIIPLLNPDGYEYSRTEDRMWRKNRANTSDPSCPGVDLNRNFDIVFGGPGTSSDPCDETYAGKGPFSEPESRALRDYALKQKNIKLYLTLHSYGQFLLYPWGFGDVLPIDWLDLDRLARVAEKAISSVYGTHYEVGSSTHLLGAAAGGSDDWMKGVAQIKYSYTVELPGGGSIGFDLPREQIPVVSKETFEAFKLFGLFIGKQGLDSPKI